MPDPSMGQFRTSSQPTHLCLDCGAVGYAGGYHDHGGDSAGDTAPIADVLKQLEKGGDALDQLARLTEAARAVVDAADRGYVYALHPAMLTLEAILDGERSLS